MVISLQPRWSAIAATAVLGVFCSWQGVLAQILPDRTLGTERSVVVPNVTIKGVPSDRIDGGALRGVSLFHSFLEFNVREGRGAYFRNPTGVETIFSRVTGQNASSIFGKLGVLGDANLFLLNPNGIIFGPNATLDVRGSFSASTADSVNFPNGERFSAKNPEAPPLLTVKVPLGLQFGPGQPGAIVNEGSLSAGQNLSLLGGTVVSTGQLAAAGQVTLATVPGGSTANLNSSAELLQIDTPSILSNPNTSESLSSSSLARLLTASSEPSWSGLTVSDGQVKLSGSGISVVDGDVVARKVTAPTATLSAQHNLTLVESQLNTTGDLNLLAWDTVRVRDSAANPFLAQAGRNLTIQGNREIDILALNHPQTPFVSGGNLSLISDGIVSGDAHFYSRGNFAILNLAGAPGNFVSLYDPIIRSSGNVTFGNYTGVSLKVEATGSITVTGDITITGQDTSFSNADGTITGLGDITIFNDPDRTVLITTNGNRGAVSATQLKTFLGPDSNQVLDNANATEGSAIKVSYNNLTRGDQVSFEWKFITNEDTPSSNFNDFAFVSLIGQTGSVIPFVKLADTGSGFSRSSNSNFNKETSVQLVSKPVPQNGQYTLSLGAVDVTDRAVDSGLQISKLPINLTVNNDSDVALLGSSPALILRAGIPNTIDSVRDFAAPQPRDITFPYTDPASNTKFDKSATVPAEPKISIGSPSKPSKIITAAGNGGPVILSAPGDISITGNINTSSSNGNGGIVSIESTKGNVDITDGNLDSGIIKTSSSSSGAASGSVEISAKNRVIITGNSLSSNIYTNTKGGSSGIVTISAGSASSDPNQPAIKVTDVGIDGASFKVFQGKSSGISGDTRIEATNGGLIQLLGKASTPIIFADTFATQALPGRSTGGNITIKGGPILIDNYELNAVVRSRSVGDGGKINIDAGNSTVTLQRASITTQVEPEGEGRGGDIEIKGSGDIEITNSTLASSTASSKERGVGGNLTIISGSMLTLSGGSRKLNTGVLDARTTGNAQAGSIQLAARKIKIQDGPEITVKSEGSGKPGSLDVRGQFISLSNGASLTATNVSSEIAGDSKDGSITLHGLDKNHPLEALEILNSLVSTSTQRGTAGNITVDAQQSVLLRGTAFTDFRSVTNVKAGLLAEATGERGTAGTIRITTDELKVENGAGVTVSSPTGQAGNLEVFAKTIFLNNGLLSAKTGLTGAEGAGANIKLQGLKEGTPLDLLFLQDESLIQANAGKFATGGNITIDTQLLLALPPTGKYGSDITANAEQGRGGVVTILPKPLGIYNIEFRPNLTELNDITVRSDTGQAGIVQIVPPDVDPRRGLLQLPEDLGDSSKLITQACPVGGQRAASRFVITGRGGLPPTPSTSLSSDTFLGNAATATPNAAASVPVATVEARGMDTGPNGEIILTAHPSTYTPYSLWQRFVGCDEQ